MATFSRQARLLRLLGHPARLRILHVLGSGEACVCHLGAALRLDQPVVSQHLMALRKAGLVTRRREGKNVYYRRAQGEIPDLLDLLNNMAGGPADLTRLRAAENCPCPLCQAGRRRSRVADTGIRQPNGSTLRE